MSPAKNTILEELKIISDDVDDELEILTYLYHRIRVKRGRESIVNEGGFSTDVIKCFLKNKF